MLYILCLWSHKNAKARVAFHTRPVVLSIRLEFPSRRNLWQHLEIDAESFSGTRWDSTYNLLLRRGWDWWTRHIILETETMVSCQVINIKLSRSIQRYIKIHTWNCQLENLLPLCWDDCSGDIMRIQQTQKVLKAKFHLFAKSCVDHVGEDGGKFDLNE